MTGAPPHPDWDRDGADWPNRGASRFVRAGTITWHVQRMGKGPTLLLLHGAGAATHSWRDLMPLLAQHFDVIAPDLPGHGFTRAPSGPASTLDGMARAVAQMLDALDAQPEVLMGHSAGAAVAIRMTQLGLLRPRLIIGLNAALTPFRGLAGILFKPMAKMLALNPVTPWMFARLAQVTGQTRQILNSTGSRLDERGIALYERLVGRPDHVSGALSMMAQWDLDPMLVSLGHLSIPLHLAVGEGDTTVPPDEAIRLSEMHDCITLHRIPGLGHLMHEEAPGKLAGLIEDIAGESTGVSLRRSPRSGRSGAT